VGGVTEVSPEAEVVLELLELLVILACGVDGAAELNAALGFTGARPAAPNGRVAPVEATTGRPEVALASDPINEFTELLPAAGWPSVATDGL